MTRSAIVVLCALFFFVLATLMPRPADAFLGQFGVKEEAELGRKFNLLVRSRLPVIDDPEVADYIRSVVDRLKVHMPPQAFEVKPSVLRDNALNAFAAPAAYLFVHTGLILSMDGEDELAGVIAHELSHISQRHIASRIERMQATSLATAVGMLAGVLLGAKTGAGGEIGSALATGSAAAGQAAMLSYSREDEREADQVGLNYLVSAGYNPQGMTKAFETIRQRKWLGGGGSIPAYLSTHPEVDERIGYLSDRIRRLPPDVLARKTNNDKFRRVQTLVRARYLDQEFALPYYERPDQELNCLDQLGRGIIMSRLNRVTQAREAFDKAMGCGKGDALFLREAGRFHFQQGDSGQASRLLQEAVMRNPQDLMALFFYARLLADSGQQAQASKYLERILQHLPEDAEVHSYLGRFEGQAGNIFAAHLHLAYAAIYGNNREQTKFHMGKAKGLARSEEDRQSLDKLERVFRERSEYW